MPAGSQRDAANLDSTQLGISYRQERVKATCIILPTGRKTAQNSVDMTLGLVVSLDEREGWNAALPPGCPEEKTNAKTDAENAGHLIPAFQDVSETKRVSRLR